MSNVSPGDFLRCVEVDHHGEYTVEVGKIYVCKDVEGPEVFAAYGATCSVHGPGCRGGGLKLQNKDLPDRWWWCGACFVPIYRPKIDWEQFAAKPAPLDEPKIKELLRRPQDA